jgi:hypothetical protein
MEINFLKVFATDRDYSEEAKDYLTQNFTINFDGTNFLHIGYYKKFSDIYIQRIEDPANTGQEPWEYYDGSTWNKLPASDESRSLRTSGFLFFNPPDDWKPFSLIVQGETYNLYFLRISKAVAVDIEFTGINTVFANDQDLKESYPTIMEFLQGDQTSFIGLHQATKKDIVQSINNKRNAKWSSKGKGILNLNEWDFYDRSQLRRAGTYLTLSKIFFNISDKIDGKFYQLAMDYKKKASEAIEVYLLFLDKNDSGEKPNAINDSTTIGIATFE